MKKSTSKLLILIPLFSITACGYSLREVYSGNAYNDPVFVNNYYKQWDERISDGSDKITKSVSIRLEKEKNHVFTSYKDSNFQYCEKDYENYQYDDAIMLDDEEDPAYGDAKKLSRIDDSFRYGYLSKLFDGRMFCNGAYQLARVQIDEKGFGKLLNKELAQTDFFAMNFKASLDYTVHPFFQTESKIDLHIGFYLKSGDDSYTLKTVSYIIDNVPTNSSDGHDENHYTFFGFKLDKEYIDIERCCGISVTYDLLDCKGRYRDEGSSTVTMTLEQLKSAGIGHALMLYEILLPNSTWH